MRTRNSDTNLIFSRSVVINNLKSIKYKGWANNRPYDKNHPKFDVNNPDKKKHKEALYFNYYTIKIEKKDYWVNVKYHKDYGEVIYAIEK